jgi:hypothetical protein
MAGLDIKVTGDQLQALGETDEHRKQFGQTFLGSLLGQTIVLISMSVAYLTALALLKHYFYEDLESLRQAWGNLTFIGVLAIPFVAILLFSMLPTGLRALRERRLKQRAIEGAVQFAPGYFRLSPYGEADRDRFVRRDGMDDQVLSWLKTAASSILYLSGASGTGKSSLLGAAVLPKLKSEGWAIVETRIFGDPMQKLREAIIGNKELWQKGPPKKDDVRELLTAAAKAQAQRKLGGALLLVIDQFEEFLILQGPEEQKDFAALLAGLAKQPVDGLKLLLVFRSDYRPLIFKLNLPQLDANANWREIGPYSRGQAESFLQGGGRMFSRDSFDRLFKGLDDIEEAKRLYRLITLNMVGLVLDKMGRDFVGDPGRLIQTYLEGCLSAQDNRDYVKPVISTLITEAGTKQPRSEAEIAKLTGLAPWQASAAVAGLSQQGLLRKLEGGESVWEISHDFLARMLGQLIGRLRPGPFKRVQPFLAPAILVSWIGLGGLAFPYWNSIEEKQIEAGLRELGATFSRAEDGKVKISIENGDYQKLSVAGPLARKIPNLSEFEFSPRGIDVPLKSLEPLRDLTTVQVLRLGLTEDIQSLKPLSGLTSLRNLELSFGSGITSLDPLKSLTALQSLRLIELKGLGVTRVTSLEPLRGLISLQTLDLSGAPDIVSLEPLRNLTLLQSLNLSGTQHITSLEPLSGLTTLRSLDLSRTRNNADLEELKGLTALQSLDLSSATSITSLEGLEGLSALQSLNLSYANGIKSLEPLRNLTALQSLYLVGATGITSLESLSGLRALRSLDLRHTDGITSLEPLKGLTRLQSLYVTGATGITSLVPLKDLKNLEIIGASPGLMATLGR